MTKFRKIRSSIKTGIFIIVILYMISFLLSSNRGVFKASIEAFVQETDYMIDPIRRADSLNIAAFFVIDKTWLSDLAFSSKAHIIDLRQFNEKLPCDWPGFRIDSKMNIGVIKYIDISNQPCEHTVIVDVIILWSGFGWKVLHSQVSGGA